MAEHIELTEELILAMRAGARAIANTKRYHGTIFVSDAFSENPKEIPYLQAAEILYAASMYNPAYVVPVRYGRWERDEWGSHLRRCSVCKKPPVYQDERGNSVAVYAGVCINCGAKMDSEVTNDA